MSPRCKYSWQNVARASFDEILTPPLVADAGLEQQRISRRNSTTMRRAFWATWSAGSTPASVARKCRTTSMWHSWKIARRCASRVSTPQIGCATAFARLRQVMRALKEMARVVDQQNAGDPNYQRLADDPGPQCGVQSGVRSGVQGSRAAQWLHRGHPDRPQNREKGTVRSVCVAAPAAAPRVAHARARPRQSASGRPRPAAPPTARRWAILRASVPAVRRSPAARRH